MPRSDPGHRRGDVVVNDRSKRTISRPARRKAPTAYSVAMVAVGGVTAGRRAGGCTYPRRPLGCTASLVIPFHARATTGSKTFRLRRPDRIP